MSLSDLSGQPICLVLSCSRPFYKARLQKNMNTFLEFKNAGFATIFLYGNEMLDEAQFTRDASGFYQLTVPVSEDYFRLSTRMEMAYQFLKDTYCIGILKVDDDTVLQNPDAIELMKENVIPSVDYFGICLVEMHAHMNTFNDDKRFKLDHMKSLRWELDHTIEFCVGSFYWLSNYAIQKVCEYHLRTPLEDLSVGLAMEHAGITPTYLPWYLLRFFTWDLDTEFKRLKI